MTRARAVVVAALVLAVTVAVVLAVARKREHFLLRYVSSKPAARLHIAVPKGDDSKGVTQLQRLHPNNIVVGPAGPVVLTDAVAAWTHPERARMRVVTFLPEPRVLVFVCSRNVVGKGKKRHAAELTGLGEVRFADDSARHLATQVLATYGVKVPDASWKRVGGRRDVTLVPPRDASKWGGVMLVDPAAQMPVVETLILGYDDLDMDKLRVRLPFASVRALDLKLAFPSAVVGLDQIAKVVSVDRLLWEADRPDAGEAVHHGRSLTVQHFDDGAFAVNNFYTRYFRLAEATLAHMRRRNAGLVSMLASDGYDVQPLLEGFGHDDDSVVVQADRPIKMFVDRIDGTTLLEPGCALQGVRLRPGDQVKARHQYRKAENGTWLVERRCKLKRVPELAELAKPNITQVRDKEKTMRCLSQPWVLTQKECEATTFMGRPKAKGLWDFPCTADAECPYFQANRRYRNYRGGCRSGFCEMPVGIKNVGHHYTAGAPQCHGCETTTTAAEMAACCAKTRDYAFPLDQIERERGIGGPTPSPGPGRGSS